MMRLTRLFLILILTTVSGWPVHAATVSPQTFNTLKKAEQLLDKKTYGKAIAILQARLNKVGKKPLEQALILRALASAHAAKGNYQSAIHLLEKALATNAMTNIQKRQALRMLGQLYLAQNQPAKAVKTLESWLKTAPKIEPEDYLLLAQAYTQLKHYRPALKYINQAIAQTSKPKESWIQLRLSLNYYLKNYSAAIQDLHRLIRMKPNHKPYWEQLTALYQLSRKPITAAAVVELQALVDMLTKEKEILQGIQLLRAIHVPYLAGRRLQQEMTKGRVKKTLKNLNLLASCWTEAREFKKALQVLERTAALSADGKIHFRLGQLYIEQEQWQKAALALRSALKKGGLKSPGEAWLLLGSVLHEMKKTNQAIRAFKKALQYKRTRQSARHWLAFLSQKAP